jgi:signal transduction histidine kinase
MSDGMRPELMKVMRLFALFQVGKSALLAAFVFMRSESTSLTLLLPLATSICFAAFVYSGILRTELGRWYLIGMVTLATVDVVMTKSTFWMGNVFIETVLNAAPPVLASPTTAPVLRLLVNGLAPGVAVVWHPFFQMSMLISLLLLLIVLSWQYDFRYSLGFTLATSISDFVLNVLCVTTDMAMILSSATIVVGRTFVFLLVGRLTTYLVGIQNAQQRSLVRANAELARHTAMVEDLAISRERNRMARELHDTAAHALTAAAVQIEAVDAQWRIDAEKSHVALMRAGEAVRGALTEMRRSLKALRAAPLEDLGFDLALRDLIEQVRLRSGAVVHFSVRGGFEALPSDLEHALYRVVQEALENVVRHSEAQRVDVALQRDGGRGRLEIIDDGVGFDVVAVRADVQRFGLRGIFERIAALGGHASIESTPGAGTRIMIEWEEADDSNSAL